MLKVVLAILIAKKVITEAEGMSVYVRLKDKVVPLTLEQTLKEVQLVFAEKEGKK